MFYCYCDSRTWIDQFLDIDNLLGWFIDLRAVEINKWKKTTKKKSRKPNNMNGQQKIDLYANAQEHTVSWVDIRIRMLIVDSYYIYAASRAEPIGNRGVHVDWNWSIFGRIPVETRINNELMIEVNEPWSIRICNIRLKTISRWIENGKNFNFIIFEISEQHCARFAFNRIKKQMKKNVTVVCVCHWNDHFKCNQEL